MLLISEREDNKSKGSQTITTLSTEVEVTIQHQKETNFLSSTPSNSSTSDCNLNIYSTTSASSTLELDNIIPSRSGRISAGSYSMGKNTEGGGVCAVGRDKEEPQHEGPNIAASNRDLHKDMDDLTSGLKACNLSVVRRADNGNEDEIVKHFKDLHLREEETITAVPRKAVLQPQESDERGSEYDNDDDDKESSDDNNERVTPESAQTTHIVGIHSESLAKLEEPTYEESEDEQSRRNEKEVQDDDDDDDLVERGGPEGGMPAAYQYNVHQDYSGTMFPQMPPSFPNYNNISSSSFNDNLNCAKRPMDHQELSYNCEPYKYTRSHPQHNLQQQPQVINNLKNPDWNTSKQVVSNVYQKQMAGGTVYTNDKQPAGGEVSVIDSLQQQPQLQRQTTLEMFNMSCPNLPNLSVEDVEKATGIPTEADDPTLYTGNCGTQQQLPPVETLLRDSSSSMSQAQPGNVLLSNFMQQQQLQQRQMVSLNDDSKRSSGDDIGYFSELSPLDKSEGLFDFPDLSLWTKFLEGGTKQSSEEDDPTALFPMSGLDKQQDQMCAPPLQQLEQSRGNRSSYGSSEDDHGYISETSPPHEVERSPAGSSHGLASSPPRSNISMATIDSGVGSPMSEDGSNQGKSPRHITNCSPLQVGPFSPVNQQSAQGQSYIRPQVFAQPQQQLMQNVSFQPQDERVPPAQQQQQQQQTSNVPLIGPGASFNVARSTCPQYSQGVIPSQGFVSQNGNSGLIQYAPDFPRLDSFSMFTPQLSPQGSDLLAVGGGLPLGTNATVPMIPQDLFDDERPYHSPCLDGKNAELCELLEVVNNDLEKQRRELRDNNRRNSCSASASSAGQLALNQPQNAQNTGNQMFVPVSQGLNQNLESSLPATVPAACQVPNLPTTVPATIGNIDMSAPQEKQKNMEPYQQASSVQKIGANSSTPKVPIPPLKRPGQQTQKQQQQQLQQVFVVNGSNVFVPMLIGPAVQSQAQRPRYPNIAPKPAGMMAANTSKSPASGVTCSNGGAGQADKPGNTPGSMRAGGTKPTAPVLASPGQPSQTRLPVTAGSEGGLVESIPTATLNKSRRVLSEWKTEKILEADHEGDNSLHNATAKSTTSSLVPLVVAILERLARENLLKAVNTQNNGGQTALYIAACTNQDKLVKLFIEYEADVNLFAENRLPSGAVTQLAAIHSVSCNGEQFLPTLNSLLSSNQIDVDLVNSNGHTALHCAIMNHGKVMRDNLKINSIPIVQALLCAGANPNLQMQQNGKTALMLALDYRHFDLLEAMFHLIEPGLLATYLKTEAFDGSNCHKIAKSLKSTLDQQSQQRLNACLKLATPSGTHSHHLFSKQQQQH
ncbi:hypothetical protein RRG08_065485 [Elysia crispata]|uniref:Uncharacterized protein n=1 Tax=Elysia crispata TaxID=231223 RepID=A0AAE1AQ84_9GAST|nr:hypothetical protein RRG08_065485 [Elysia crispata]